MDVTTAPSVSDSEITQYQVEFTPDDTVNYSVIDTLTAAVKVNKAPAAIEGTELYKKAYGDEEFALDAASTVDLPLTYEVVSGESVSVDDSGNVTINKTGTTVIKVSSSDPNYEDASMNVTVEVGNKTLDVSDFGEITATEITFGQF